MVIWSGPGHRGIMRAMLRTVLFAVVVAAVAGCSKPSEEDCRKAVLNLQRLRGLEGSAQAPDPVPAVRRCRAGATRETVLCLINAKSASEADRCAPKQDVN
jgi:hypothetical protein